MLPSFDIQFTFSVHDLAYPFFLFSQQVGKSTLLLQTAASVASLVSPMKMALSGALGPVWYVSGEETQEQIASRAQRLQLNEPELWLLSETHVDSLAEQVATLIEAQAMNQSQALYKTQPPSLVVIDSIQTMICDAGGHSAAGGVTQMRECVALLLRMAKSTGIPIILVGHVTKSGDVAGPRTVEHMVVSRNYSCFVSEWPSFFTDSLTFQCNITTNTRIAFYTSTVWVRVLEIL